MLDGVGVGVGVGVGIGVDGVAVHPIAAPSGVAVQPTADEPAGVADHPALS